MSAIAGLLWKDGRPVDPADLDHMIERLAHRGPDAGGVWREGPAGLGHRALWTTPESRHEKLPLCLDDCVVTADARLDNRDELVDRLGVRGRSLGGVGDAQLILHAYRHWGENCAERLRGDFAFAIWDSGRRRLMCARDHFGAKPFYYHRSERLFAFASEIKGLLALADVPRRLNEVRVADYLVPMLEDPEITFYRDVVRLPPAHVLIVDDRIRPPHRYWALDPSRELRLGSNAAYAEAFHERFVTAVRPRLRNVGPVGSMLSGGLDSSSIVCAARRLLNAAGESGLHTFSLVFDDVPECDERPFIEAVVRGGGLHSHLVQGDRLSPLADLDAMLDQQDEAFYTPNLFLHLGLYQAAARAGVRVVLDGLDGDTVVSHGIAYLAELARSGRWLAVTREVRGLSRRFGRSAWDILLHRVLGSMTPPCVRGVWRVAMRRAPAVCVIRADWARTLGIEDRVASLAGWRSKAPRSARHDHYRALTSGLVPFALEVADRAAAPLSVEPRYPFFDPDLAGFCLALPGDQKLGDGWSRLVMRRAMAGLLPAEVQWRGGKADLSPNFVRSLRAVTRSGLDWPSGSDAQVLAPYVDLRALGDAYRRAVLHAGTEGVMAVWRGATLARWLAHTGLRP